MIFSTGSRCAYAPTFLYHVGLLLAKQLDFLMSPNILLCVASLFTLLKAHQKLRLTHTCKKPGLGAGYGVRGSRQLGAVFRARYFSIIKSNSITVCIPLNNT